MAKKETYKFNKDNLTFIQSNKGLRYKITRLFTYVSILVIVAIILNVLFSLYFDTPQERQIRLQNEKLMQEYKVLLERYNQAENVLKDVKERDKNIYRIIFESEPLQESDFSSLLEENAINNLEQVENSYIVEASALKLDALLLESSGQKTKMMDILRISKTKSSFIASLPIMQPVKNKDLKNIAAGWGWKIHPIYKIKKFHFGTDFTSPRGTSVFATGDGIVETSKESLRGHGNRIVIDHGFGYKSVYAHLGTLFVKEGQRVKRGDVIAEVGSTGVSMAPHLHYEVHKNGVSVDPVNYFLMDVSPDEYQKLIQISANTGQSFD